MKMADFMTKEAREELSQTKFVTDERPGIFQNIEKNLYTADKC